MTRFDYKIISLIHQGNHSIIYKALRIPDKKPVIIKVNTNNTSIDYERLKKEFKYGSLFNDKNIIKYIDHIHYKNEPAIILEDIECKSLKKAIPNKGFSLNIFFRIAIQMVDGLKIIHKNEIIHKNINPNNILINFDTNEIKISDFSISSSYSKKTEKNSYNKSIDETLDYISPEQTGRLNYPVDYRTDFYSIGITFYELLCGRLPFNFDDSMETIHSHIALKPFPLHEVMPGIPEPISQIILKLISKNPEDRYNSCHEIKYDLEKCVNGLNFSGSIGSFTPGSENIPVKFQIAQKLYDRDEEINIQLFHYYRNKEITCYLHNNINSAMDSAKNAEKYYSDIESIHAGSEHPFYYSLILLKHCHSLKADERKKYISIIKRNLVKVKTWADNCEENFLHKYLLIEAELAHLENNYGKASDFYNRAIESAHENDFMHIEAISYELAAVFYLDRGMNRIAAIYMAEAHRCFSIRGAAAKVKQLENNYSKLFVRSLIEKDTRKRRVTDKLSAMDMSSIIKASHSLSNEIHLENLMSRLIQLLMKNAGADKGFLILEYKGELKIEAEMDINSDKPKILHSIPVNESGHLSSSIVNYVAISNIDVILDQAYQSKDFKNDPYIIKNKPLSIVCASILNRGELAGVLYLENNSTRGAFTPDRVEILKHLSYQGAISIKNARLYDEQKKALEKLNSLNIINERLSNEYKQLSLKNLQKRMNPHFLFNAIHTIHALMRKDVKKAENAIIMMGDIYHFIADMSFKSLIPFKEEWDFMKNYLKFDEINFPGAISYSFKITGDFDEVMIPPLTLQPLVENSIKHGLRKENKKEILSVNAEKINNKITIEVRDNGTGLKTDDIFSGTLGNIRDRLKYNFKNSGLLIANMESRGVKAVIYFEQPTGK